MSSSTAKILQDYNYDKAQANMTLPLREKIILGEKYSYFYRYFFTFYQFVFKERAMKGQITINFSFFMKLVENFYKFKTLIYLHLINI